jgi:hypothetical protein
VGVEGESQYSRRNWRRSGKSGRAGKGFRGYSEQHPCITNGDTEAGRGLICAQGHKQLEADTNIINFIPQMHQRRHEDRVRTPPSILELTTRMFNTTIRALGGTRTGLWGQQLLSLLEACTTALMLSRLPWGLLDCPPPWEHLHHTWPLGSY